MAWKLYLDQGSLLRSPCIFRELSGQIVWDDDDEVSRKCTEFLRIRSGKPI